MTPTWVPGLSMSLDWYSINVKGIISAPSTTLERNFCTAGTPTPTGGSYCADWVYNSSLIVAGSNPNGLQFVYTFPYNNGFLQTSGLDFVADYSMDLFSGNLAMHLLGNYTDEETQTIFGSTTASGAPLTYDYAGSMGPGPFAGVPKLHVTASATYTEGPWSGTVQTRYYGPRPTGQWLDLGRTGGQQQRQPSRLCRPARRLQVERLSPTVSIDRQYVRCAAAAHRGLQPQHQRPVEDQPVAIRCSGPHVPWGHPLLS